MKNLDSMITRMICQLVLFLLFTMNWDVGFAQGDFFPCLLDEPIINSGGCDYTAVPNDVKTQNLIINGDGELIFLGYCATQQEVIDAFLGWFEDVIDPETDCSDIRIETVEVPGGEVGPEILVDHYAGQGYLWDIGANVNPFSNTPGQIRVPRACVGGYYGYEITISADCDRAVREIEIVNFYLRVYPFPEASQPSDVTVSVDDFSNTEILNMYDTWVHEFYAGPEDLLIDLQPDVFPGGVTSITPTWGGCMSITNTFSATFNGDVGFPRRIYSDASCSAGENEFVCFRRQLLDGLNATQIMNNDEILISAAVNQSGACIQDDATFTVLNPNPCQIVASEVNDVLRPQCQTADFYEEQFANFIAAFGYNEAEIADCGIEVDWTWQKAKVPVPTSGDRYEFFDPNTFSGEDFRCEGEITVRRRIFDIATNQGPEIIATFRVVTPDGVIINCPADVEVEVTACGLDISPASTGMATGSHGCTDPIITYSDNITAQDLCTPSYTIIRTWTATDICGNSISCDQTITVTNNNTAPEIDCPSDVDLLVNDQCFADTSASETGMAILSSPCPGTTITRSDLVSITCSGSMIITRTWTATDACGNTSSCDQMITVSDDIDPIIGNLENVELYRDENCLADTSIATVGVPTVSDNCTQMPKLIHQDVVSAQCGVSYDITRTWTATDDCGNIATKVQMIHVRDTTSPTIICPNDIELFLDENCATDDSPMVTGVATATDNCSSAQDISISHSDEVIDGCGGSLVIIRTWTATDACGNSASCDQIIEVLDTTRPRITCPADVTLYLDADCLVDDSPATTGMAMGQDNCTSADELNITHEDEIIDGCGSSYTIQRTWSVTDACDNTTECLQMIMVLDSTPPTMDCLLSVELGINPNVPDAGPTYVTVSDNCGIPQVIVQQGDVEITDCHYSRLDTYTAIDACGNSNTCTRLLTWKVDLEPPVLFNVPANTSVDCESPLPDVPTDVEALDVCDGSLKVSFKEVPGGTRCGGRFYERIWTAIDEAGNRAQKKQIIRLTDNLAPKLTIQRDTTIQFGNAIPEPWYEVSENCSHVDVDFSEVREDVQAGTYSLIRTWTARDGCGNQSQASQRIEVIDDVAPEILLVNPVLSAMENGGTMEMYGCEDPQVSMGDIVVADANPIVEVSTYDKLLVSHACETWGYYRKWKCGYIATDGSGNETELFFYVVQYDTTAPELLNVPPDVQLACGLPLVAPIADVAAVDDCGAGGASITLTERFIEHPEDTLMQMLLRTWSASDACGNSASATQSISTCDLSLGDVSATIGDCVWEDSNGNGLQDSTELGIDSVRLNLYWVRSDMSLMLVDSTYSSSVDGQSGQYLFEYVFPGTYQVEVVLPNAMKFTMGQQGNDASLDSDITSQAGMTDFIEIDSGSTYTNVDAGLLPVHEPLDLVGDIDQIDYNQTDHKVEISLYPNPTHETAFISFSTRKSMEVDILVVDQWGRTIQNRSQILPQGSHREIVELQAEPDGLYWVTVRMGSHRETKSLLKFN